MLSSAGLFHFPSLIKQLPEVLLYFHDILTDSSSGLPWYIETVS